MAAILYDALGDWIEIMISCSDSEIGLSWVVYEKSKLNVFHRLRVANIRNKIDINNLYHVDGKENCSDLGTRPDHVTAEKLSAGSEWLCGKPWMKGTIEEAVEKGILRSTSDIVLSNEKKKQFKEAVIYDSLDLNTVSQYSAATINVKKMVEIQTQSSYIIDPLKRSFRPTVRTYALFFIAVKRFLKPVYKLRAKHGKASVSDLEKLNFPPVKFQVFNTSVGDKIISEDLTSFFVQNGCKESSGFGVQENLTTAFGAQVWCNRYCFGNGYWRCDKNQRKVVCLSDEALSYALEHLYQKATEEFIKYRGIKMAKKHGVLIDGILFSKSRLLEEQTIRKVGELEKLDLKSLTGVGFRVPMLMKESPLAFSIANHLHYQVCKHKGVETTYRISQQYAAIHQGRSLMKDIAEDCVFCKKDRLSYLKQIMGPLDDLQISVSPIFYVTYVDAYGPLKGYTPGFSKATRAGSKTFELYLVIFCCAATATCNIQCMVGGKDVACFLDVFNRFFAEACVPKMFLPDKDSAILKVLGEAEVDLVSLEGVLSRERGITFKTCSAQGHSAHGRVEARIKMLQQSLDRSSLKNERLHGLGWQTLSKIMEREVNSIPLGFLQHHHQ